MRLTKRQLKRIIREEYTRLKRKGLIREMGGQDRVNQMIMFLDDLMSSERGMELEYDEEAVIAELERAFPDATIDEVMEALASF